MISSISDSDLPMLFILLTYNGMAKLPYDSDPNRRRFLVVFSERSLDVINEVA